MPGRLLIVVSIIVCGILSSAAICAETKAPATKSTPSAASEKPVDTNLIARNLGKILGSPFPSPPKAKFLDRKELIPLIKEEMERQATPQEMEFQQRAIIRFGLVTAEFDLKNMYLKLLEEQASGLYIPVKKTFYLMKDAPLQKMIAAHELTHAYQDQSHDLEKLNQERKGDDDRLAALMAITEGEAMLSMTIYMKKHGGFLETMGGVLSAMFTNQDTLNSAPLFLRESLLFPYLKGQIFVSRSLRRGGWHGVRRLFYNIPQSTEQILHPEKYYEKRDKPTVISLDGIAKQMKSRKILGSNTVGEFGASLLLRSLGMPRADAENAVCGWDGDEYILLEDKNGDKEALIWLSTWDTPDHAHRFTTKYGECLAKKHGKPDEFKPWKQVWTKKEKRRIILVRWDREVLLLDGLRKDETILAREFLTSAKESGTLFTEDNRDDIGE